MGYRSTNKFHYIKKGLRGKFLSHVKSSAFDNFFNTDEPKIIIYLIMKMFLCKLILSNGSVNYKLAHLPPSPHPQAFIRYLSLCFGKAANAPRWGLKIAVQNNVPPRDNTKISFSSKYWLQIPNLWKICNN